MFNYNNIHIVKIEEERFKVKFRLRTEKNPLEPTLKVNDNK